MKGRWIKISALSLICLVAVLWGTGIEREDARFPQTPNAERPMLVMDGQSYVAPYMPVSRLPYGYALAGTLREEQANHTGLEGLEYYTNPNREDDFYVYQECGTPIDINTVDSTKRQWAYVRWIKVVNDGIENRLLTLDDVLFLARKGDSLAWTDFDLYSYVETGSGLYIRIYEIDEMFSLWIGGPKYPEKPMYFYLQANDGTDEHIDIRDGDVAAFVEEHEGHKAVDTASL